MTLPALIRIDGSEKFLIDQPSMVIGRSHRRADFQIDDASVSSVHCELQQVDSRLIVRDRSRYGILVNGRRVDEAALQEGDILEIAGHRFQVTFHDPGAPPVRPLPPQGWYARLAGIELGPMPWDELVGMAERGELQKQDEVRSSHETAWKTAAAQRGLFDGPEAKPVKPERDVENGKPGSDSSTASDAAAASETEPGQRPNRIRRHSGRRDENCEDSSHSTDELPVLNLDELAEDEVAALSDEAATQPPFSLGSETGDPLGDTVVPVQGNTVTDADVFRKSPARRESRDWGSRSEADPRRNDSLQSVATGSPETARPTLSDTGEKLPSEGWVYRSQGSEFGPVDLTGLKELAEAEMLLPDDSVKRPDDGRWIRAGEISAVFPDPSADDGCSRSTEDTAVYDETSFSDLEMELPDGSPVKVAGPAPRSPLPQQPVAGSSTESPRSTAPPPLPAVPPRPQRRGVAWRSLLTSARGRMNAGMVKWGGGVAVLLLVWVCWPAPDIHRAYVNGQIHLDGQPLQGAAIMFTDPAAGWGATATLGENGEFEISTVRGGLKPGRYLISLMPEKPEPEHVVKELQRRYLKRTSGDFRDPAFMMEAGPHDAGENAPLEEGATELPPGTIPIRYRSVETSNLHAEIQAGHNDVSFNLQSG